jgi:heme-degrading monooxygenase HmoA
MYARIVTSQMKVSHLATAASIWQKSATEGLKPMNGFQNSYLNVDQTSGKWVVISFWETKADAEAVSSSGQYQKNLNALEDCIEEGAPIQLEIFEVLAQI